MTIPSLAQSPAALLFDRSARTRLRFTGPQAIATLNGLVTNDVAALTPGQGLYAAALTPKGKMIADLRVLLQDDGVLVDTSPRGAPGLLEMFKKYVNPRFARIADLSGTLGDVGIFGVQAADVVASVMGTSPETFRALASYAHLTFNWASMPVTIARIPELGGSGLATSDPNAFDGYDGYDVFVPREQLMSLRDALLAAGATASDEQTWHTLRIVSGRPEWGVDMDESTLPQEANFDALHGVSYTKGCYTGQETVARIHFRGHVNRTLRRLAIEGVTAPPSGTELVDAEGKVVGDLRSITSSPMANGPFLGIGMVRREVSDGTALVAHWTGIGSTPTQTAVHVLGHAPPHRNTAEPPY